MCIAIYTRNYIYILFFFLNIFRMMATLCDEKHTHQDRQALIFDIPRILYINRKNLCARPAREGNEKPDAEKTARVSRIFPSFFFFTSARLVSNCNLSKRPLLYSRPDFAYTSVNLAPSLRCISLSSSFRNRFEISRKNARKPNEYQTLNLYY